MLGSHGSPRTPDIKASIAEKPRVAVLIGDPSSEVLSALRNDAWTLVPCEDGQALLETVVERLPSAIVVEFTPTAGSLAILNLIRRAAPRVPLILVAGGGNLDLQRALQDMRPYYYDVAPLDPTELREAVQSAVSPPRARAGER
jgi:DNA-binding NtrC family response regulator